MAKAAILAEQLAGQKAASGFKLRYQFLAAKHAVLSKIHPAKNMVRLPEASTRKILLQ
jgi:hypothetical protein